MKIIGGGALAGLLLGLAILYWLQLTKPGAVGLVLTICMSAGAAIGGAFSRQRSKDKDARA